MIDKKNINKKKYRKNTRRNCPRSSYYAVSAIPILSPHSDNSKIECAKRKNIIVQTFFSIDSYYMFHHTIKYTL